MLGSADPKHVDSSDQSAAKNTDYGYECKRCLQIYGFANFW